jgi:hypothetical protein
MKLLQAGLAIALATLSYTSSAAELAIGVAATKTDVEDAELENGRKYFATFMATDYFGFEVAQGLYGDTTDGELEFSSKNYALILSSSGPVSVYGKVGVASWKLEVHDLYWDETETVEEKDRLLGVGLNIKAGDTLRFKLEYEKVDVKETDDVAEIDVSAVSLGIAFAF